jgi:nucleotide-binding universal stress UspA family protein
MSYFKYAERSSESRVDWNEISKGMVDMLKEQTRLRNEKLDDAVKLQGEVTTTLSEAPMGSDVNANQRVSEFAADAQEYSLMMNKLWRSGEMSYREYMAATNNFKTNTDGYLSQAEKYAANYEKHVKRMEEQLASGVEVSELARVEDFGNFSKFTPVIDAPTGSIGLVGEDGTKYASVTQLGVAVMSQYDRLDVEGRTTDVAKQMGTTIEVLKAGDVRTLESALQNENYLTAEDEAVSGILIGDNAYTSVLVDFKRGLYSTTHDINDAITDPNAILMVPSSRNSDRMIGAVEDDAAFERYIDEQATRNGQPLTPGEKTTLRRHRDAQREQSFETVRDQLRARLDFKETPTADTSSSDSDAARKARERAAREARMVTNWDTLGTGTPQQQTVAAEAIVGMLNEGKEADERIVDRIVPDESGQQVTFFYPDGTSRNVSLVDEDGNRLSRSQWLSEGTEFHGVEGDYGRFYEGGIVPAGSTQLERGERTVGYEEPAVGYDTETAGYDPQTGKAVDVTPRGIYAATTSEDSSSKNVTVAALSALRLMDFENPQLSVVEVDRIDFPGTQSWFAGNRFEDAVKYFVPGVMPYQVFVPEEDAKATVGLLNELVAVARAEGRQVTIEQLKAAIGPDKYDLYNTQEMRNANPVDEPTIERPADNTQQEDPLGIL